jgi:hypothetical protein
LIRDRCVINAQQLRNRRASAARSSHNRCTIAAQSLVIAAQ